MRARVGAWILDSPPPPQKAQSVSRSPCYAFSFLAHEPTTITGRTGWQGKLGDLEHYQQLRKAGDPGPLLRIAEKWLRTEIEESRRLHEHERELGEVRACFFFGGGGVSSTF